MNKVIVTLFSKPQCSLCVPAKELVLKVQKQYPFTLENINILQHPEWFEKYKYDIPVLHVNGKEICRHRFDEQTIINAVNNVKS
mmetsp:Transcript_14021/g.19500  ORF Transcript_14021/g.19500 Transcript_14021/m.19500 type:complete len:84 (-) Transcript_14021:16-267(-)